MFTPATSNRHRSGPGARDGREHGIRANSISPGLIESNATRAQLEDPDEDAALAGRQDVLADAAGSAPPGIEIHRVYDQGLLVRTAIDNVRDAMLVAAGRLDTRMYGPGTLDQAMPRRSVYFRGNCIDRLA